LTIVITAVEILEHMCCSFRQSVLWHTTDAIGKTFKGFTDEEKAAMRNRAKELKAKARAEQDKAAGEESRRG